MAKNLCADPKSVIPGQYHGYMDQAANLADQAAELKKQKDALQLQMLEKAIDPLWSQYDTENTGYVSKD